MFSPRFSQALLLAVVVTLVACSNNNQTAGNETDSAKSASADTSANTTAAPASTIVTTPRSMLVVVHRVANYAKWKMAYDGHDSARLAAGIHSYVIGRGVQDSNMIQVSLKVDDTAKALAFEKDPGLKAAMQNGGVIGTPRISLLTVLYQDTGTISSMLRSSVMFRVNDWDTWLKNFQEGDQERKDNGLTVRAYAHDASDNHKVRVVTALIDSAKAVAYFKSDMLKKRMQAAGIKGEPDRFLYRIVQRY